MDIFSIAAKIKLDTAEFSSGIESAGSKVAGFSKKIGSGLAKAAKVGAAAVTAMATTTLAGIGAIVKATDSVADYGDNIDKMSQKMGISATAYQEWDAVMQHSGTSMESLKAGMKTLANAVESGNKAFGRLGITEKQIAKMNNEELFAAVIEGLQNVEDETERTYLAGQLLGRGATELGALLNQSAEETQAMKDRVHELGGVMSDEAVKQAAAYKDQLQDMKTSMSGFTRGILTEFMPMITEVMSGITDIFSGDKETGFGKINSGIKQITDKVTKALPDLLELGGTMVTSIADGLWENVPLLVETGGKMFGELIKAIPGAINSITELLTGSDGELLQMISDAGDFLVEQIPIIVDAGLNLFSALLNDLPGIVSNLTAKLPEFIDRLLGTGQYEGQGLLSHTDDILNAGIDLLGSLLDNVPAIIDSLAQGLTSFVDGLVEWLTDEETLKKLMNVGWKFTEAIVQGMGSVFENIGREWFGLGNESEEAFDLFQVMDDIKNGVDPRVAYERGNQRREYHDKAFDAIFSGDENAALYYMSGGREWVGERPGAVVVNNYGVSPNEVTDEVTKALNRSGVYAQ